MRSTFFGLEIGYRGLAAHQKALDVTGHNVANISTPGYSRQRAEIISADPFTYPAFNKPYTAGQVGTGVDVAAVKRIRDTLIDEQIRYETSTKGYWESRQQMLGEAELVVNEPADSNIRTSVNQFWEALQAVKTDASSIPARSDLQQKTLAMCDSIREDYARFQTLRIEANQRIIDQVAEVNRFADQIAELNDQIGKITAMGDNANDLMDKRDQIVEELSKRININCILDSENRMTVTVKGVALVNGVVANHIIAKPNPNDMEMVQLKWSVPKDLDVDINNGSLMGLLEVRDRELPKLINELNEFASTLIHEVNALHQLGYGLDGVTGRNFFKGTDAATIDLDDPLKDEVDGVNRIAASDSWDGLEGNNKIMLRICELKHARIFTSNTATMGEFIGKMVDELGEKTAIAASKTKHQTTLIANLDERRESVCGVSMDEEMTNMVRFQHGYNAAAKIISTMDEMLDVVINRLKM